MRIEIIGVPFNGDGTPPEIENPVQTFRDEGLIYLLIGKGHSVLDNGDLDIPSCANQRHPKTNVLNFEEWRDISLRLSATLVDVLSQNDFPIVIGGDCSILVGVLDAFKVIGSAVNLFFLDGHADFHDTSTSPTGEPADMELAAVTGYLPEDITCMTGRCPLLAEEDVIVYGIGEYDQIETSNITVVDRKSVLENGVKPTFDRSMKSYRNPNAPLWLHFDVDVLDKLIMPAIHYPVDGGLSYYEASEILTLIMRTDRVVGMSLACYHPKSDPENTGIGTLLALFDVIF